MQDRPLGRPLRFAIVGIAATVAHGCGLVALGKFGGLSPFLANAGGFGAAMLISYFGHKIITFRSRQSHMASLLKFTVQIACSWSVTSAVAVYATPIVGVTIVALAIMVIVPILNYVLYATWTFRGSSARQVALIAEAVRPTEIPLGEIPMGRSRQ